MGALWSRRSVLSAAAASLWLAACTRSGGGAAGRWTGAWVGQGHERGHQARGLQKSGAIPAPALQRRASVLVVGAGVAGLACARELALAGHDDVHILELEDQPGGNARGHRLAGFACPLGAHYLPVPPAANEDLLALLSALGLCELRGGRWVFDERHLCHTPQERLFIDGMWHEGLLPVPLDDASAVAAYRQFGARIDGLRRDVAFALPTSGAPWTDRHAALDALPFTAWLDREGLQHPLLRAHLDYCCRDDYGVGMSQVSAWAGLHYFASRHGFDAPGHEHGDARDAVLTWPEGNGWLTRRMADGLGDRVHTGRVALRVEAGRHDVHVDVWDVHRRAVERWSAGHVVLATPLHVTRRLMPAPDPAVAAAMTGLLHAPWLVANLHIEEALDDPPGAPPAWDNVIHGSPLLGYVDAMHQSMRPHPGPTVLTSYWALGGDSAATLARNRSRLLADDWRPWARDVVADLSQAHPDLPSKVRHIDLMRYGHAMSVPVPGRRGSPALAALAGGRGRLMHAHSDLAGYSIFEEAFAHGVRAARDVVRALSRA